MRRIFAPVRIAAVLAALLVGSYYHWQVRAAGFDIVWQKGDLAGYYNYLAQAFTAGHLYLPVKPAPELLALANPWDPSVDNSLKLWDTAFYNGRFYLYHGAGPAVMAFAPWRLLTGNDLPENAGIFAFAFGGYLFAVGTLLGLFELANLRPRPVPAFLAFLALGICQNVPFLINRVWVYEVAIAGGYFCVSTGLFCLVRYLLSGNNRWLWPSGFFFGMAVACRPHLGLVGALAFVLLLTKVKGRLAPLLIPFIIVCSLICVYNFQRFGNPLQFGTKYLLGNAHQNEIHWRLSNLLPGFNFLLFLAPRVTAVFPWFHGVQRPPGLPLNYAFEPIVGGLWMAPFLILALLELKPGRARHFSYLLMESGAGIVLFIAGTGWSVQRYETDFLPLFVLAALTAAFARLRGWLVGLLLVPGMVVSLAFGFSGPYDEMLRNKPARYVRIAGWFSPVARQKPLLNPRIEHTFTRPAVQPEGTRDVLIDAGPSGARYELRLEQLAGKPILISQFFHAPQNGVKNDLPPVDAARQLRAEFDPATLTMTVTQNGAVVLVHKLGPLVTAPSEIYYGPSTL